MSQMVSRTLARLEEAKQRYVRGEKPRMEALLRPLARVRFENPDSLIRCHDILLFLRAFPPNEQVARICDRLLDSFSDRVRRLRDTGVDMSVFDPEEVSGIGGTTISDSFTFEVARWLWQTYPSAVRAQWNEQEQAPRLAATLPRFLPVLEEDSLAEADVPYLEWLRAAGGENDFDWLMRRFEALPFRPAEKTETYDALRIALEWNLGDSRASRTLARWPASGRHFFHEQGFIQRRDVSLECEFASPDIPVRRLSPREGKKVLDMERTAVTIRYRELYGTTRGDPAQVVETRPGRGVRIFLWGLPPDRRLPLRAYHAGITVKNGVPIGYIEDIGLFEWVEVGFNTFYAYRDGESAWIYSKILHLFHQLFGYTCFSVYPYQIGLGNEEAIKSGAFWFYRKLGFRPGRPDLLTLAQREETKMAADPKHRTSPAILRKLAAGHVFYEIPGTVLGRFDRFSTRRLGIAAQREMAKKYGGDPQEFRSACRRRLAQLLQLKIERWTEVERKVFDDWAVVLSLVPGLAQWKEKDKRALTSIIRSKTAKDETTYLRRLQAHKALRTALVKIGSAS